MFVYHTFLAKYEEMRVYGIALSDPIRVEKLFHVFKGQDKPYVLDEHFYRGGNRCLVLVEYGMSLPPDSMPSFSYPSPTLLA